MKFVPNSISSKIGRQILLAQKGSPKALFIGGVVGVAASTVLACRATLKLEELIDETKENLDTAKTLEHSAYSEEDRRKDVAYIYARSSVKIVQLYGPSLALGVASIAALTMSHNILTRRNAALTAAYAALDKGFQEYRKRVADEFGEDKEREIRYAAETRTIVEETDKGPKTLDVQRVGANGASIYARFFDEYSNSWSKTPEYNYLFIRCQQNYANDLLQSRGHLFLNEVYDMLGIERSKAGAVVGWVISKDGDNYVDFGVFDGSNPKARDFVNGREGSILLDFNVDGVIYDKI